MQTSLRSFSVLLVAALLGACSAKSDVSPDAGPATACHPAPGFEGNAKNVGAYCSPGGGECAAWGPSGATACAIDLDPEGDNFCILVGCKSNEGCGEGACCVGRGENSIRACVPKACVVAEGEACPAIPSKTDGGSPDAGSDSDAGE